MDIYGRTSWILAIAIFALSFLDAVFTALQLQREYIREANPVMETVLRFGGVYTFASVKAALTLLPLGIIIVHQEWTLARFAARLVLLAYLLVTAYHIYLIVLTY